MIARNSGCVICGRAQHIERNHVGGRNHIAWFTMPFCRDHHAQFHALLRAAGVNLEWTDDPCERGIRALKALKVAGWMVIEALAEHARRWVNYAFKAQAESAELPCFMCERDISGDDRVFRFGGPMTFVCGGCAAAYIQESQGTDMQPGLLFSALHPSCAIEQRRICLQVDEEEEFAEQFISELVRLCGA